MTFDTETPRGATLGACNFKTFDKAGFTSKTAPAQGGDYRHRVAIDLEERRRRREAEAAAGIPEAVAILKLTNAMRAGQTRFCRVPR